MEGTGGSSAFHVHIFLGQWTGQDNWWMWNVISYSTAEVSQRKGKGKEKCSGRKECFGEKGEALSCEQKGPRETQRAADRLCHTCVFSDAWLRQCNLSLVADWHCVQAQASLGGETGCGCGASSSVSGSRAASLCLQFLSLLSCQACPAAPATLLGLSLLLQRHRAFSRHASGTLLDS